MGKVGFVLCTVLALAGCKTMDTMNGSDVVATGVPTTMSGDQAVRECRYDANKSVAAVPDAFEQGWDSAKLFNQCLDAKGYAAHQG